MEYYALQVRTRTEEKYIKLFTSRYPDCGIRLLFLRKRMPVRKKGLTKQELCPLFPGYIIIESERTPGVELRWALKHTDGFFRFLVSNNNIKPLEGTDLKHIMHFIRQGPIAERSLVMFDENDRIVVQSGPLKGLEGNIIRVDKRKGRAKIQLDLCTDSFAIDLAFEVMQKT